MTIHKTAIILITLFLLPGCAAVPFGLGLIPGAPAYLSSVIGNGQSAYESVVDERSSKQQMLDAIIAGHAQAELYKHKEIRANQITAYCYFGKLYLVGEYDSQEQLRQIYECMDKVKGKRVIVSRLYIKEEKPELSFLSKQAMYAELRTQLMADFEVTSSPVDVEIVQGDIILLGVISDKEERDRILAHALTTDGVNRVVSYLYHSEKGGPEPRIMTARLNLRSPRKSTLPKTKKPKEIRKPVVQKKEHSVLVLQNSNWGR